MCTGYPPRCSRWDTKRSRPPWSACKAGWRSGGSPSFWARNSHGRSAAATRRGARRHPRPSRAGGWRAAALDRAPRRIDCLEKIARIGAGSCRRPPSCASSPSSRSSRPGRDRPAAATRPSLAFDRSGASIGSVRSSRSAAGSTTAAVATCAASPSTPRRSFRRADNRPSSAAPDPTASCGSSPRCPQASAGSRWAAAAPECPPSPPAAGRTEWSD